MSQSSIATGNTPPLRKASYGWIAFACDRINDAMAAFTTRFGGALPLLLAAMVFTVNLGFNLLSREIPGADDREQLASAAHWAWGYSGVQPPLHTWFVIAMEYVAGDGIAAVYGARFLLLFLITAALFALGRQMRLSPSATAAGALGVFLLPQIGWEAQRSFSHSLSAMLFVVLFMTFLAMLVRTQRLAPYLMMGAAAAFALLGKYNTLLPIAAASLSILVLPQLRRRFERRRVLASVGVAAAILAGPAIWLASRLHTLDDSREKFAFDQTKSFWRDSAAGLGDFFPTTISYLLPLLIVAAVALAVAKGLEGKTTGAPGMHRRVTMAVADNPALALLVSTITAALVIAAVLIVASGATEIKIYWLHPLLVIAPPAIAGILSAADPSERTNRGIVAVAALFAVVTMVVFAVRCAGFT